MNAYFGDWLRYCRVSSGCPWIQYLTTENVIQHWLCIKAKNAPTSIMFCVASGWVTSFTEKQSSTAGAIMPVCVLSAASACPSSTLKPASPRTTATSGWSGIIVDQVRFNRTRKRSSFFSLACSVSFLKNRVVSTRMPVKGFLRLPRLFWMSQNTLGNWTVIVKTFLHLNKWQDHFLENW